MIVHVYSIGVFNFPWRGAHFCQWGTRVVTSTLTIDVHVLAQWNWIMYSWCLRYTVPRFSTKLQYPTFCHICCRFIKTVQSHWLCGVKAGRLRDDVHAIWRQREADDARVWVQEPRRRRHGHVQHRRGTSLSSPCLALFTCLRCKPPAVSCLQLRVP